MGLQSLFQDHGANCLHNWLRSARVMISSPANGADGRNRTLRSSRTVRTATVVSKPESRIVSHSESVA